MVLPGGQIVDMLDIKARVIMIKEFACFLYDEWLFI